MAESNTIYNSLIELIQRYRYTHNSEPFVIYMSRTTEYFIRLHFATLTTGTVTRPLDTMDGVARFCGYPIWYDDKLPLYQVEIVSLSAANERERREENDTRLYL